MMSWFRKAVGIGSLLALLGSYSLSLADDKPKPQFIPHVETYMQDDGKKEGDAKQKDQAQEEKQSDEQKKSPQEEAKNDSPQFIDDISVYVTNIDTKAKYKKMLGKQLVGILVDECDFVEYMLQDFGQGEDLVVICYEKDSDLYKPEWVLDMDDVCRAYARINSILGINTKAYFVIELSKGHVSRKSMSVKAALELTEIVGSYLPNNDNRCENWKSFIRQNYGPAGPAGQN